MLDSVKSKGLFEKWMMILTGGIIVAYPITRFVLNEFRSSYLILLFLLSLIVCSFCWSKCRTVVLTRLEKLLLFSFFLMFFTTLMSFVLLGGDHGGQTRVGVYMSFVFAIPIYFLFKLYSPSSRVIWGAIVIACYVVALRALLEENGYVAELTSANIYTTRANGTMHPIRFGNLSLLMAFISLAGVLYLQNINRWMKMLGSLAFVFGLTASVLSESRGGWIAVPVLLAIVMWPIFRGMEFKKKAMVVVSIIIVAVALFNLPAAKIGERFDRAVSDVKQYQLHNNSNTSIGARFDMYETALWMFSQNPLFGVGVGNYQETADSYFEKNKERMSGMAADRDNPHNEILQHMATRGVAGLIILLLMFVTGITMFVIQMRRYDERTLFYAISGLMIFVAYLHFGMSIALFMHRDFILFFIIYALLFSAGANKRNDEFDHL